MAVIKSNLTDPIIEDTMKNLKNLLGVVLVTAFSIAVSAESSFEVGKDYEVTAPKSDSEPLVEEFFNYACGACYGMEKFIGDLKENNPGLKVKAVPVELRPAWKIYVKAYYIGEKLNVLDKSHAKLFHRIHVENKFFKGEDEMKTFFLELGVEEKAYDDVANSYWINTQMRLAKQYSFKHKVSGTPSFLVNKRFKLNNQALGDMGNIEQAIQHLSGLNKAAAGQ